MTDKPFNPARARDATLDTLNIAATTLAANADRLLPVLVAQLNAPDLDRARAGVKMAVRILVLLMHEIETSPIEEVKDAGPVIEAKQAALRAKAH